LGSPLLALIASNSRQRLNAPLSLYVSNAGDDTNPGTSPATAFASLQHAWNFIRDRLDLNGYQVTVNVADGAYAPLFAYYPIIGPTVKFIGNPSAPGNVLVSNPNGPAISAAYSAALWVESLSVSATSSTSDYLEGGSGFVASNGANLVINNVACGACTAAHLEALSGGSISFPGPGGTMIASGSAMACLSRKVAHWVSDKVTVSAPSLVPVEK
jgi:hypothetical protein